MDVPSPRLRFASASIHIFGASILAYCFAAYTSSGHLTWKNWRQAPWARLCIMLVFIDSWLFHVSAGLLIHGPGISNDNVSCTTAIFLCITIYCLSKVLIYSFLIERVYVVWPHNGTRFSSKAYCLCVVLMLGYVVVTTLMIVGRNAYFDSHHHCIIGLKAFASIPLLSYDLFINIFLTSMFLWPLQQAHFRDVRLRKIATRTLFAALMALTTSAINIAVLTVRHGKEAGWICLLSCGLDVSVNAVVLFWVTGYRPDDGPNVNYLTTINFTLPYSTPSLALSSARADRPPALAAPAPARDKAGTHRPAPAPLETTGAARAGAGAAESPGAEWSPGRSSGYAGAATPASERALEAPGAGRRWLWRWRRVFRRARAAGDAGGEKAEAGRASRRLWVPP